MYKMEAAAAAEKGLTLAEFLSRVPECARASRALGLFRAAEAALQEHEATLDECVARSAERALALKRQDKQQLLLLQQLQPSHTPLESTSCHASVSLLNQAKGNAQHGVAQDSAHDDDDEFEDISTFLDGLDDPEESQNTSERTDLRLTRGEMLVQGAVLADSFVAETRGGQREAVIDADVVVSSEKRDWFERCFQNPRFRFVDVFAKTRKDVPVVLWDSRHRFTPLDRDPYGRLLFGHSFGQCENWLTCKDALLTMVQLVHGRVPWFPDSFRISRDGGETGSLRNQFLAFLGTWLQEKDTPWIIKPASEARSKGIVASKRLPVLLKAICEHVQAGAVCVACRYVERPLLLSGHKFDLRFVVALRNAWPIELFVYDYFVVRRAATPFAPDDFEDQLQHLTVVQYLFRDPKLAGPLLRPTQDFPTTGAAIAWFEEHTELKFDPIIRACFDVIRDFFQSVCYGHIGDAGERIGLVPDDRVRAVYGLDILLQDQGNGHVQPVLLECNYKPDNRRLFQQRPRFLDQLFDVLYPGPQGPSVEFCEHRPSVLPSEHGEFIRL